VDDIVLFDRKKGLREVRRLWKELRRREFDLVLNLNVYFKAAVPTIFARTQHRLAFGRDRARDLVWLFADHNLPPRSRRHNVDMFLEFLDYLGLEPGPVEWRLAITEAERAAQADFFGGLHRPVIGLVPTTGRDAKDWATGRFAELATRVERDLGATVLLLGGPDEREVRRAAEVVASTDADPIPALGPDLRRLVWLIDGCDLVVAGDTGPLHIARALETPVVGLYGHTDPAHHGPYRAYEELLVDRFNYEGPGRAAQPSDSSSKLGRMPLIPVDEVLTRVEMALANYMHPTPPPRRRG
jgi:heptosyltransferase I